MEYDRISDFIDAYLPEQDDFLKSLEQEALKDEVPIIRRDTQQLIRFLLSAHRPEKILEIGTAIAFSAILMAKYSSSDTKVVTVEDYEPRLEQAKRNIKAAGLEDRIRLIEGDGSEVMAKMQDSFDMIFIDAAKAQYPVYFEHSKRLLRAGGLFLADNCLKGGEVVESRYAVTRRNRTIHKRMREFLYEISVSEDFVTTILPVGDGVVMAVKKADK
ncbi:MAG: O-methyltransferase [Lachnospiraceae bacterium]|nr:O-methyltransferase [Lachnospiraceae bacterium]